MCSRQPLAAGVLGRLENTQFWGGGASREGGGGRPVIVLTDQNFSAVLPTATGNCLAIIRIEHGSMRDLADLLLAIAPETIPEGTVFLLGSLTQLQNEGLQGYSSSGVRYGKKIAGNFKNTTVVLFIPPPHGWDCQPPADQVHDGRLQLAGQHPWLSAKEFHAEHCQDCRRGGGGAVPLSNHPDMVVYLPSTTDDYSGSYLTSPGRRNIPATLPLWSSLSEKKFIDSLIEDLNKNMLAGRDKDPNLSRSASRPAMYTAIRTGAVEAAVFVGGSNALNLAYSASALGLDAYQLAKGGWKLTKDNVDKIIPDLRDVLGSVPPDTPVVLFCLDNSCFMGLADDGSMTHISRSIEGDDGFHVQGALVVAPERALKNALEQKKRLIEACGTHPVFIISPWPRFVRSP